LYGALATVYCDSVTLISASIIIIIIIVITTKMKTADENDCVCSYYGEQ